MGNKRNISSLPTEPFVKKEKDSFMYSENTNNSNASFSAGDMTAILHAEDMFDLRKSELTPLAMRLAKDTATTVFMSEFHSKVLASNKKRNSNRNKTNTTVH